MKKNICIMMVAAMTILAASCTKDNYIRDAEPLYRVILSGDCSTKISLGAPEAGIQPVIWSAGDLIGVWTDENGAALSGAQNKAARVLVKDGSGPGYNTGSFYTDLPLSASSHYDLAIYYPFLSEAGSKNSISHSVPGRQRQSSADESRHLGLAGTFAYATAEFDTPSTLAPDYTPEVNFTLSHKTANVQLAVKAADSGLEGWKIRQVSFTAPTGCYIAGEATYNPSSDSFDIVSGQTAITMDVSGGAVLSTEEATDLYMVAFPVALAGKQVTIKYILENPGATLTKTVSHVRSFSDGSQSLSAGKTSCLPENIPSSDASGWTYASVSSTDLSANGTANCYIAYVPGDYSFDATVIGNGQKGILLPVSTTYFHTDNASISPESAELLWQTAPGLISNVSYSAGKITFTKGSGTGNAVIAAKDGSGNIVWSWHIWCTKAGADLKYVTEWGSYEGMDRNLGAQEAFDVIPSSAAQRAKSLGLYYQWGRKDPFVGPSTLENYGENSYMATDAPVYNASGTAITFTNPNDSSRPLTRKSLAASTAKTTGSIIYTIKNPQTFLYGGGATTYDWLGYTAGSTTANAANKGFWLWGNPQGYNYSDKSIPTPVKTVYDPCPPGYMVPPADAFSALERVSSSAYIGSVFHSDGNLASKSFFPCCSCIQGNYSKGAAKQALFIGDGFIYMYSSTINGATGKNAYMLYAGATTMNTLYTGIVKADALGIRCVQEIVK